VVEIASLYFPSPPIFFRSEIPLSLSLPLPLSLSLSAVVGGAPARRRRGAARRRRARRAGGAQAAREGGQAQQAAARRGQPRPGRGQGRPGPRRRLAGAARWWPAVPDVGEWVFSSFPCIFFYIVHLLKTLDP